MTGLRPFWRVLPLAVGRAVAGREPVVPVWPVLPPHAKRPRAICWNDRSQSLLVACIDPEIGISVHYGMGQATFVSFAFWHFAFRVPNRMSPCVPCAAVGAVVSLPHVGVRSACPVGLGRPLDGRLVVPGHALVRPDAVRCL